MKAIVAKKVSMLELFYDLIFVYAISKITAMIHHPVAGGLPMMSYLEFCSDHCDADLAVPGPVYQPVWEKSPC